MAMRFEELDQHTRGFMLREFEAEESSGTPYRGKTLSEEGRRAFPLVMRHVIRSGNEMDLARALLRADYWQGMESYARGGVRGQRAINHSQAATRLATSEFNTW